MLCLFIFHFSCLSFLQNPILDSFLPPLHTHRRNGHVYFIDRWRPYWKSFSDWMYAIWISKRMSPWEPESSANYILVIPILLIIKWVFFLYSLIWRWAYSSTVQMIRLYLGNIGFQKIKCQTLKITRSCIIWFCWALILLILSKGVQAIHNFFLSLSTGLIVFPSFH